jgi:transposase
MFITNEVKVWLCNKETDMRKSIDGLSILVAENFDLKPGSGELFVFYNRHRDKLKILYWDNNGFAVWYKRIEEKSRFKIPQGLNEVLEIDNKQLRWLLDGLNFSKLEGHKSLTYKDYF